MPDSEAEGRVADRIIGAPAGLTLAALRWGRRSGRPCESVILSNDYMV